MRTKCMLIVIVCLLIVSPMQAIMETGGIFLESEQLELIGEVNSAAQWQGGTLLGSSTGIYFFPKNHTATTPVQLHVSSQANSLGTLTAILTEGNNAYALSLSDGRMWSINMDAAGLRLGDPILFDTSPLRITGQDGAERVLIPAQVLLTDDKLCVLTRFMHELGGTAIIIIDTKTGEAHPLPQVPGQVLSCLSAYTSGKVLALEHKEGNIGVRVVDLATGSQEAFASLNDSLGRVDTAILFDPNEEALYILSGMRLFKRSVDGKLTEVAYFNIGSGNFIRFGRLGKVGTEQFTIAHSEGMVVGSGIDGSQQPLVILGLDEQDPIHASVMRMMGSTPLHVMNYGQGEVDAKLAEVLVGGSTQPDILTFYADDIDSFRMMKKGFVADLSAQDAFVAFVKTTYPLLQDLCFHDGQLYFLPIEVQFAGINIDPSALKQSGVKAPASMPDLITLMASWIEQGEQWEGVSMLSGANPKAWLVDAIWHTWLSDSAAREEPLRFQDARLEKLINQVDSIDWASWPHQSADQGAIALFPRVWGDSVDLSRWTSYRNALQAGELLRGFTSFPLPLSIDEQATAVLPLRVKLMGINPHSKQQGPAIKYLNSYVQSMSAQQLMLLSPAHNKPLLNPERPRMIELAEDNLRLASEALVQAADNENMPLLRERVEQAQRLVNYWHQAPPLVSDEAIRRYHDLIALSHVLTYQNTGGAARDSLETLLGRLSMNTIPVAEIIQEGERILRLASTEGN